MIKNWSESNVKSQKLLFAEEFEMSATEMVYLNEILDHLNQIGFEIEISDHKKVKVLAVPTTLENQTVKPIIETLINSFKENNQKKDIDFKQSILTELASSKAITKGVELTVEAMQDLIDKLFASSDPQHSPRGKKIYITYHLEDIIKKFN
jgi:DNA mismatch repair protein MutL